MKTASVICRYEPILRSASASSDGHSLPNDTRESFPKTPLNRQRLHARLAWLAALENEPCRFLDRPVIPLQPRRQNPEYTPQT